MVCNKRKFVMHVETKKKLEIPLYLVAIAQWLFIDHICDANGIKLSNLHIYQNCNLALT